MRTRKPTKAYWRAYSGLYGRESIVTTPTPKKRVKKARECPTEEYEQTVAVAWIRKMQIPVHHSPNGGRRDAREGAKFKRLGTSAGFPDLYIPKARKGYHGLYIEMKPLIGGVLSESQIYWRDLLLAEGYAWFMARGAEECKQIIRNYFRKEDS